MRTVLPSASERERTANAFDVFVNPVLLGSGAPMFKDVRPETALRLARAETLGSGVVVLCCRPVTKEAA